MKRFIHLECHSSYSLLEGVPTIAQLIFRALELNQDAIALTDTNGLYGVIEFQKQAHQQGIKPIFGTEIHLNGRHAILLARNLHGFKQLAHFLTEFHTQPHFNIDKRLLRLSKDVYILTSDEYLLRQLPQGGNPQHIYITLQTWRKTTLSRHQAQMRKLHRELKLPLVLVNNVHFLSPEDYESYQVLRAIQLNTTVERLVPDEMVTDHAYLKTANELWSIGALFPEAFENTWKIADECQLDLDLGQLKLPGFLVDKGTITDKFPEN
jgi:DNA polymerase III alpha subunit